ncbi:hypothetical protein FF38_06280 [Lucilia cuprina]|uniref:Uncharacterized protein n=1 Tax=Lucilia cuprina TaxID=7375 RepID=A0A0L0CFM3_LUCCU|nr:hypothetical protein FF38_06280 [Lucilia cuprina]
MRDQSPRDPTVHQCRLCDRYHSLRFCGVFWRWNQQSVLRCLDDMNTASTPRYLHALRSATPHAPSPKPSPRITAPRGSVQNRLGERHRTNPHRCRPINHQRHRTTSTYHQRHHTIITHRRRPTNNTVRTSQRYQVASPSTQPRRTDNNSTNTRRSNNTNARRSNNNNNNNNTSPTMSNLVISEAIRSLAVVLCVSHTNN